MRRALLFTLVLSLAIGSAAGVAGAGDIQARRHGSCSGGPSHWRLIVSRESASTLLVRFRIEDGESDQTWQLFMSDNGERIFAASKVSGADGLVRVRRRVPDRSGTDRIKGSGVNMDSGETCSGALAY